MAEALRTVLHLVRLYVKTRLEYRMAFFFDILCMFAAYSATYIGIWVVLNKFGLLGGWNWAEMAFLLSFQLLGYSLGASLSFVQFRNLEDMVRRGQFDVLLVKPFSPWAYITFSGLNIGYAGHIVLAVGLMVWALGNVDVAWTVQSAIYFPLSLISGALVVTATMTMIGASAMVLVQSRYLFYVFFGFWELTRYPLHIYPAALQWLMLTIVPLGYMNYVPVAVFLGKDVPVLGAAAPVVSLLAGPVSVLACIAYWRFCIRRYQGGGG